MEPLERITERREELDAQAAELAKRLQEINAEREELAVAERVLTRLAAQTTTEAPASAQVAGRAVLLAPHRRDAAGEGDLPADHQKILTRVRAADGPVRVKDIGAALGLDVEVRGKLEPLRSHCAGSCRSWPAAAGRASCPTGVSPPCRRPKTSVPTPPPARVDGSWKTQPAPPGR